MSEEAVLTRPRDETEIDRKLEEISARLLEGGAVDMVEANRLIALRTSRLVNLPTVKEQGQAYRKARRARLLGATYSSKGPKS